MKKTLSLIMAALFVMSCLNVIVFADDAHAVAAIDSKAEVVIGEEFDVYVTLEDYDGITALVLDIAYDSEVLEQTSATLLVTEGVMLKDYKDNCATYIGEGTLDAGIAAADGKVLKLTFKAIADSETEIVCSVGEEAGTEKSVYEAKATINVVKEPHAKVVIVSDAADICIGDEFDVYVTMEEYANITALVLDIAYDSEVLEQTSATLLVAEGVMLKDYKDNCATYIGEGTLDAGIAAADGKVLKLTFKAIAKGEFTIACTVGEEKVSGAQDAYVASPFSATVDCRHTNFISEVTTPASCIQLGVTTYTCDACGYTYTEEIALEDHTWGEWENVKEATEEETGLNQRTCGVCGEVEEEVLPMLNHVCKAFTAKAEIPATCNENGTKAYYVCEKCGLKYSDAEGTVRVSDAELVIPAAHTYGESVETKADCLNAGKVVTTCEVCGAEVVEVLPALGHKWSKWKVVTEATEEAEGLEERTCSVCGEKETRVIEKIEKIEEDSDKWSSVINSIRYYALSQQKKAKEEAKEEVAEVVVEPDVIDEAIVEEPWENPFIDIFETDSYYAAIEFVYENGLFKGVSATEFAPDTTMTRAMFVTVLGRLHGITEDYVGESVFEDVVAGEWYAPYVVWAADNGIVLGYGDGTFGINDEITVEQAAVILARYAAFIELDVAAEYDLAAEYADAGDVAEWAVDGMTWVVAEGIYNGVEGNLNPQVPAARALVATMLYNFVK